MERVYTVPLWKAYLYPSRKKRAKRAIRFLREFLARHMRVPEENVRIGNDVNEAIWSRGIQKPPRQIQVLAKKENNVVYVSLVKVEKGESEQNKPFGK